MDMSDLLDDVARVFGVLIQGGCLSVVQSLYDENAFGNAVVTLAASNFRLRLVRDRGQLVAEVACDDRPDDWSSLQRFLHATVGSLAPPEGVVSVHEAALMVETFYDSIQDACASAKIAETRARLAKLEQQAMKAFIERAKAGSN